MDELTLTLNSPITDEQFDQIADYSFDNTDKIWFHTKQGKVVEFVKRKKGMWIIHYYSRLKDAGTMECDQCHMEQPLYIDSNFCPNCGADMRCEE